MDIRTGANRLEKRDNNENTPKKETEQSVEAEEEYLYYQHLEISF
jgi:hypothetical protein